MFSSSLMFYLLWDNNNPEILWAGTNSIPDLSLSEDNFYFATVKDDGTVEVYLSMTDPGLVKVSELKYYCGDSRPNGELPTCKLEYNPDGFQQYYYSQSPVNYNYKAILSGEAKGRLNFIAVDGSGKESNVYVAGRGTKRET